MDGKKLLKKIFKSKLYKAPEVDIDYDEIDYDDTRINGFEDAVFSFLTGIRHDFALEELNLFFNNLKDLKIIEVNNLKNGGARYDIIGNVIKLSEISYFGDIYHELFHAASSFNGEKVSFCGFYQHDYNKGIGRGLTEGYTQRLTEKYFGDQVKQSYLVESYLAKNLEYIVGFDVMKKLYITADLRGLINHLSQYVDRKEVINFLRDFDCLESINRKICLHDKDLNPAVQKLRNITCILAKTYQNKLLIELRRGMDISEFNGLLWSFVDNLSLKYVLDGKFVEIMTRDELYQYLNESMPKEYKKNEERRGK